jgi:hypothetical protein
MRKRGNYLLIGAIVTAAVAAGIQPQLMSARAQRHCRYLQDGEMSHLMGGVCGTQCWNMCTALAQCGACQSGQGDGENCPGSSSTGTGLAFICLSAAGTKECSVGTTNPWSCAPSWVCRCVSGACTQIPWNKAVQGDENCTTGHCES